VPSIFGRLLYGSKFHQLKQSRGQQGIGISAAGMYGLLTTGKSVQITSRTSPRKPGHFYELQIDTKKNRPEIIRDEEIEWDRPHGTSVSIELEQTAIANPHATLVYRMPDGSISEYARATDQLPREGKAIKPHPYGIELGVLIKMLKETDKRTLQAFLTTEFSRVSGRIAEQICQTSKVLTTRSNPTRVGRQEAETLYNAINATKIMAPGTGCIVPIGEDALEAGLRKVIAAEFYAACSRPPSVYRGNPFCIEAALAYGGDANKPEGDEEPGLIRMIRFANRVPLLYQQSAGAMYKGAVQTNWRNYGLSQSRGALPAGPVVLMIHIASVWVPFTSESKEAVAHYPEIIKDIKLALQDVGRKLGAHLRRQKRIHAELKKRNYIESYIPHISEALQEILGFPDKHRKQIDENLKTVLEKTRMQI
jgi:DNA topoisomerase-6 subunit B